MSTADEIQMMIWWGNRKLARMDDSVRDRMIRPMLERMLIETKIELALEEIRQMERDGMERVDRILGFLK